MHKSPRFQTKIAWLSSWLNCISGGVVFLFSSFVFIIFFVGRGLRLSMHHASLNRLKLAFGNFMDTPNCQTGANSYRVIRITVYKTLVWLAPASSNHLRDKPIGYLCESDRKRPHKVKQKPHLLKCHGQVTGLQWLSELSLCSTWDPAYRCGKHAMSCNVDIFQEYVWPHQLTKSKLICETSQVACLFACGIANTSQEV